MVNFKRAICLCCNKEKNIISKKLCPSCYYKNRAIKSLKTCILCNKEKEILCKKTCSACYQKKRIENPINKLKNSFSHRKSYREKVGIPLDYPIRIRYVKEDPQEIGARVRAKQ